MKIKSLLSLLLVICMVVGVLASCSGEGQQSSDSSSESTSQTSGETEPDGGDTESSDTTSEETDKKDDPSVKVELDGIYSDSLIYANEIKNGVQSYYPNGVKRDRYYVENLDMCAEFDLMAGSEQKLRYLSNKNGGTYLENTMDVFVRMKNGITYYASNSSDNARANVYRIGYYYYDVRILEQSFYTDAKAVNEFDIDESLFIYYNDIASFQNRNGTIRYKVGGGDPYLSCKNGDLNLDCNEYDAIQFTIKSEQSSSAQLFVVTDKNPTYNSKQSILFNVNNDGEFHTYTIMLSSLPDYSGNVIGFRLDLGQTKGEIIELKDMKAVKFESESPYVKLDRTWHTYSDKLHQELHFVAPKGQDNIDALGMVTEIAADKVAKLIVKDANGLHTSLNGVDWESTEYVGFDIKDAGIFGYIMPADNGSGRIEVTLENDRYVIIQEAYPENGEIRSPKEVGNTTNDFFMGQRLYTDESHSFDEFIKEADWERNPLKGIQSDNFVKYDALRGAYLFTIGGTSFNPPYFSAWNQHFSTEIKLRNTDSSRNIYIRTASTTGCLENAVLLDESGLLIPLPLEVSKNFGELEEPVMNYGDVSYSETVFPFVAAKNEKYVIKVLNLYQNWGKFPLKQLSSIAYYAPYYHLSCGVTETTCISPWYVRGRTLWTLPDFRSQSAPYWFELEGDKFRNEPQHTNAGVFEIIQYTDADGNYVASENYHNAIDSSGPIYAEVRMDYISDDGKMKITYNHLELPQTDELRPAYEISIEILDDISFDNFKKDFAFYAWNTTRTHVGYLNADGEHTETTYSASDDVKEYILGKVGGYFGNYGTSSKDATNLGFVIHSSEIYFGGEKFDGNFVVVEDGENRFRLSLDLGEATFKKGDTVKLNIFMVPWGSHLSTDAHNLAYIRENSVIDPYKVTAIKGEVIESVYLPRVKTDDGKSAEFTVSGGVNNAAVRVYGFDKLTAPVIYEKIDGEWQIYTVSSVDSPDAIGLRHYYDGYMTYYDGDGTYSYAFAFSMDGYESRTFKVEAIKDFEPWPEINVENNDPISVYADPAEIAAKFQNTTPGVSSAVLSETADYVRLTGDGKNVVEVRIEVFSASSKEPTGQYLVVKYRMPSTNPTHRFEFFTSTVNTSTKGGDSIWLDTALAVRDGEWHVLVVDASTFKPDTFQADSDGKYYANYISFDVFNTPLGEDHYVDLAYVGICDDLEVFRALDVNGDVETYTVASKGKNEIYNMSTGELISSSGSGGTVVVPKDDGVTVKKNGNELIASDGEYKLSSVTYFGRIDTLNGYGPSFITGTPYNSRGSSSAAGIATFKYNGKTCEDLRMVFAGWSLVIGGAEKYVWSVDGKTWHEVELYNKTGIANASSGMVKYANDGCGVTNFDQYVANSSYQGGTGGPDTAAGLAADLSAYEGQTVNVIFAVVPSTDPESVCILAHVTGVEVSKTPVEEETGGAEDEVENPYNDPINYYLDANEMNAKLKDSIPAGVGKLELDENGEFLRFYGDGSGAGEAVFYAYSSSQKVNTGKYIVVKFRMPSTNTEGNHLQIFASTVHKAADATDSIYLSSTTTVKDDAWHVIVIDAASFLNANYAPEGGRYYCNYIRFDVFNVKMSESSYIDVAYIGIGDDLDKIRQLDANAELDTLMLVTKEQNQYIKVDSGEIVDNPDGSRNPKITYVQGGSQFVDMDNAQGYVASDAHYFSRVDALNGLGYAGSTTSAYDMGSNDKGGIVCIEYDFTTADKKFAMAGWALVEGGIEKYVWSADGGKTWNDIIYINRGSAASASDAMIKFCASQYGSDVDFSSYKANSSYQGNALGTPAGMGADLSAFAGQTVDLTFAAVSAEDNDSLCILIHIKGIKVAE